MPSRSQGEDGLLEQVRGRSGVPLNHAEEPELGDDPVVAGAHCFWKFRPA
jgi:hypothetical protein